MARPRKNAVVAAPVAVSPEEQIVIPTEAQAVEPVAVVNDTHPPQEEAVGPAPEPIQEAAPPEVAAEQATPDPEAKTIPQMEAERAEWLAKRAAHGEMANMEVYEECCANLRRLNYAIIEQGGTPGK